MTHATCQLSGHSYAVVKSLADVRSLVDQESHECAERQAKVEQLVSQQLFGQASLLHVVSHIFAAVKMHFPVPF